MKQKYCKVSVVLGIGNRKSAVQDPVEIEEDANSFDGELNTLILDFIDAVKSLPCANRAYTRDDVRTAICACLELQPITVVAE